VSGTRVAEATKMLENTYRFVNIAMVNELAILHERLGIDFFEVIAAASTKPFGFQAFYPGPGVGGHCIPKDPHYLSYRARQVGLSLNLVETSQSINQSMVDHILSRLENRLGYKGRTLLGAKATILGLAFKPDVSDTRNSPSIGLAEELERRGAEISVYDPYVASVLIGTRVLVSADGLDSAVRGADLLFLMTPHSVFRTIDLVRLCALANRHSVIVDTRGFWTPGQCRSAGFDYLGLGRPEPFAEENREAK
jgi:nucleotide sugar dehydrogenase